MRARLAGALRLETGPVVLEGTSLGGRQVRLALAYLLMRCGHEVPRSELADVLWDGYLPASWEPALRNVLSRVRKVLAPLEQARLQQGQGTISLTLPSGSAVDVLVAGAQVVRGEELLVEVDLEPALAAAESAAVVLAQPFLPGENGAWSERIRGELGELLSRALVVVAEARLQRGDHVRSAQAAADLLQREPLLETAHQLRMRALAAGGNRGEALQAYDRCRRTLVEELGVGPSVETEWVYLSMLADDVPPEPAAAPLAADRTGDRGGAGSFVGRAQELARLQAAWEDVRSGRGRVVLVAGEAGIGKTRLGLEAATLAAGQGALVLSGRCDEDVPVPYQPFSEALDQYVAGADAQELRRHLGWGARDVAALVVRLTTVLPELTEGSAPTMDGEPSGSGERLFEGVAFLLRSLSTTRPVVLLLDDLHWADRATTLLLRYLARALSDAPVLLFGTYRDDDARGQAPVLRAVSELAREPGVVRLPLGGLGPAEVADLLHTRAPGGAQRELAVRLVEQTGGNPFFLAELLRHASNLRLRGDEDLVVPQTVTDVVAARSARLSTAGRQLLRAASVLGQQGERRVLQQVVGLDDELFSSACDEVEEGRFLLAVPGSPERYQFAHVLLRTISYGEMTTARRIRLHEGTAAALQPLGGRFAADVARHLVAAGRSAQAVQPALAGAAWARVRHDDEQAARLLHLALSRLAEDDHRRLPALLDLGAAHRRGQAPALACAAYQEAAALARRRTDALALADAALGLFGGATHGGATVEEGDERTALLEEALAALGEGDSAARVRVLSALAYAHYFDARRRTELAHEALSSGRRLGQPRALSAALSAAWTSTWGPQRTHDRLEIATEMVEVARGGGDAERELSARLIRLGDLVELGDRQQVDTELGLTEALLEQAPVPWLRWRVTAWRALLSVVEGRDDAEELIGAALAARADRTDANAAQCFGIQLVCLRLTQGRAHEVLDLVRAAVADYPVAPAYRCVLALCLAEAGQLDEARLQFEHFAANDFSHVTQDVNWITSMAALADTCVALADARRAELLHQALLPVADRMAVLDAYGGGGAFWGSIAGLVGRLECVLGRHVEAERHLRQAIDVDRRFGAPWWVARSERALLAAH